MGEQHHNERAEFLASVASLFESGGMPRLAGRIFGILLISERPQMSIDELAAEIPTSRASVSTMTRLLIQMQLIDRIALPGDRRDYFRMRSGGLVGVLKSRLSHVNEFRRLVEDALALVSSSAGPTRRRLEEVRDLYAFLEKEIPALIDRWESGRRGVRAQAPGP